MKTGQVRAAGNQMERVVDAPREAVWRAWTDPEQLSQWWLPDRLPARHCSVDLRPGGHMRFRVRSTSGDAWLTGGVFYDVEAPSWLVYREMPVTGQACGESPAARESEHVSSPVTRVLFEDLGDGRTKITLR
jgi:uncharacterized protein YndB with AHSA1/START domain